MEEIWEKNSQRVCWKNSRWKICCFFSLNSSKNVYFADSKSRANSKNEENEEDEDEEDNPNDGQNGNDPENANFENNEFPSLRSRNPGKFDSIMDETTNLMLYNESFKGIKLELTNSLDENMNLSMDMSVFDGENPPTQHITVQFIEQFPPENQLIAFVRADLERNVQGRCIFHMSQKWEFQTQYMLPENKPEEKKEKEKSSYGGSHIFWIRFHNFSQIYVAKI